jgi:SAM-dependent methyltransferase
LWLARERGLTFERGLTLGCGAGRLERSLLQVCRSFHGIDISENAIATAREIANRDKLPLTYEVGDVNFMELAPQSFDLVVAQTSLHHVLFLERVAEQVWRALKPDGYLWIHDFIGETQGQWDEERLALVNRLLAALPEKFRTKKIDGRVITQIERPEPGGLETPFESIRSAEIVPVFERWFRIEWRAEFGAIAPLIVPSGCRAAYLENEDTKALFEFIMMIDDFCLQRGILTPTGGQYLMRPKSRHDITMTTRC